MKSRLATRRQVSGIRLLPAQVIVRPTVAIAIVEDVGCYIRLEIEDSLGELHEIALAFLEAESEHGQIVIARFVTRKLTDCLKQRVEELSRRVAGIFCGG